MRCPSCGRQLHDDESFCVGCGAFVTAPVSEDIPAAGENGGRQDPAPDRGCRAASRKRKKKKKGAGKAVLIAVLAIAAARLVAYGVREAMNAGTEEAAQIRRGLQQPAAEEPAEKNRDLNGEGQALLDVLEAVNARYGAQASEEYAALFRDAGIAAVSALPLESGVTEYAFAKTDEDGWVFRYEFACEGDIICTMADTIYIPVQGYSEGEIEELRAVYEELFAPVAALDFCTMTMDSDGNYFTLVIVQEDMDNEANIRALEEVEYLDALAGEGLLSMEQTAQCLREQGMTEK